DGDSEVPTNAQIFVQFNRSVAALTTLAAQRTDPVIAFEPALHGAGEWLNTSIYRFVPTDLAPATTYRLKIAKGLTSAADGVLQDDFRSSFATIDPAVDSIQPDTNWIYCGPWQQVDVAFNPSTFYTVDLLPGATDRYGQAMGGYRFSFTTGAQPPTVSLALPGYSPTVVYSSSHEPILYFQVTNMPSVDFTLWPLSGDEGRRLLHDFGNQIRDFKPSQPALRTWTETVAGPRDDVLLGKTSLSGKGPLPKGYYFVRTSGQYASQFVFAVVDTVLVTKVSNDELVVWALDHDTGAPLKDVLVRGTGPGLDPAELRTDANGLATFKVPAQTLGNYGDRSYLMWIDAGGRNAVMSTRWQQGTSPYQLGIPGEYYAREWVGHVYMDRPIHRPGDTIDYKAILRADD